MTFRLTSRPIMKKPTSPLLRPVSPFKGNDSIYYSLFSLRPDGSRPASPACQSSSSPSSSPPNHPKKERKKRRFFITTTKGGQYA